MRNNNKRIKASMVKKRPGFTLMEVLLVTALLSVLAASSFSIIYWQMRVQAHVTGSAVFMNKLVNTQLLMRKVLRSCSPASLTVNVAGDMIRFQETALPAAPVDLFAYSAGSLKYRGQTIHEGIVASFSNLTASGTDLPDIYLEDDCKSLIKVSLTTDGRESRNLAFLVRPRGYKK